MIAPDLIGRIPINWSERAENWQVGRMDHWWAVTQPPQHLQIYVKLLGYFIISGHFRLFQAIVGHLGHLGRMDHWWAVTQPPQHLQIYLKL